MRILWLTGTRSEKTVSLQFYLDTFVLLGHQFETDVDIVSMQNSHLYQTMELEGVTALAKDGNFKSVQARFPNLGR